MTFALLLVCGLVVADGPPGRDDRAAYEEAQAHAGRGAEAQVKLALWCEAHGLSAERLKHLARAVLTDPANATARGLMGLVAYGGGWARPDAVAEKVRADEALAARLAEYNDRRARTPETADAQWRLALWCEENGLEAEAKAHLSAVVRLDSSREAAWKKLGCRKVAGRWLTDAQVAAEKAEAEAQKQADKKWKPLLTKWRAGLSDPSAAKRREAEEGLASVTDPRAAPMVWVVFAAGADETLQKRAVQLLGQIDAAASSRALAALSFFGVSPEVRRGATETLRRRDVREFADLFIALIRKPLKYEVKPVGGPGTPGVLFVEGQQFNLGRLYAPPPTPRVPVLPGDGVGTDANGLPVVHRFRESGFVPVTGRITGAQLLTMIQNNALPYPSYQPDQAIAASLNNPALGSFGPALARIASGGPGIDQAALSRQLTQQIAATAHFEHKSPSRFGFELGYVSAQDIQIPVGQMVAEAQRVATSAQRQLEADVAALDAYNSSVRSSNGAIVQVLDAIAGKSLGDDLEAWKAWWIDQLGYASRSPQEPPKPTVVQNVPLYDQPQAVPVAVVQSHPSLEWVRMSCFGAGTLVRTLTGPRPIESLKVGDRVLTQILETGALGYRPVVVVHHNPPSPTFLVKVSGDTIVSSPFHRFWVVGRGWVMARELTGGETLRLLGGPAKVDSVTEGPIQPVFNLDAADDHDFFAGAAAALVHDNTLPDTRLTPFDAVHDLVSAAAPGRP
jgi:hypothetical protein